MATGDLQASLDRVRQQLRRVRCPVDPDVAGLLKGESRSALPLLSHVLTAYSRPLVAALAERGLEVPHACADKANQLHCTRQADSTVACSCVASLMLAFWRPRSRLPGMYWACALPSPFSSCWIRSDRAELRDAAQRSLD